MLEKSYIVFRRRPDGVVTRIGIVRSSDQVTADTKARRMFGHGCWTRLAGYGEAA